MSDQEPKEKPLESENLEQSESNESVTVSQQEWEKLQNELKDLKDKNLRILAESENTRKRLQKEKLEMQTYAKENLACEFLGPIDHFSNALSFKDEQSDEVKNWMVGFEMILTQFKDVLAQNEIRPIETEGKLFDPHFHEAMEIETTDEYPAHTIIQEYVRGYMMGERVLRPAKVKVAKSPADASAQKSQQEDKKLDETIKPKEG